MPATAALAKLPVVLPSNDDLRRHPLRAAVLSAQPARLIAALAANGISATDAARTDLSLMLSDAPDLLIVDIEPGTVSARRLGLLVAQLGWARRDLVIAVAQGRSAALEGTTYDMLFNADASDDELAVDLGAARQLLAHSRLRRAAGNANAAPALLRRAAQRRASLFR